MANVAPRGAVLRDAGRGAELIVLRHQHHDGAWVVGARDNCTRPDAGEAKRWGHQYPPRYPRVVDLGDHQGAERVTDQPDRNLAVTAGHFFERGNDVEGFADTAVVAAL